MLRSTLNGAETLARAVVNERSVRRGDDILREGEEPTTAHLLLSGQACRYRMLNDGRRQITAFLVPGDLCDLEAVTLGRADYSVGALMTCVLGVIPAERIADPTALEPEMMRALWRVMLREQAISREWMVGLGRRSALEKVAHLMCEFLVRLEAVGQTRDGQFEMRLTQHDLGDVLGLSSVHMNRVLQHLRRTGLVDLANGVLAVLNRPALEALARFNEKYLRTP